MQSRKSKMWRGEKRRELIAPFESSLHVNGMRFRFIISDRRETANGSPFSQGLAFLEEEGLHVGDRIVQILTTPVGQCGVKGGGELI
jgi:hypothetical protein